MQAALKEFVDYWKVKAEVDGILLCGSYAVGLGNENSDIDIRLILKDNENLSFKGLQEIKGFSFSYLGRTKITFTNKFNSDFFNNSKIEARNFHLGQILYDDNGVIRSIKEVAQYYFKTSFLNKSPSDDALKDMMYSLYSKYEYLRKCRVDSPYFIYNYILFLRLAFVYYANVLKIDLNFETKLERMLNDPKYISMYSFQEFPDKEFIHIWEKCLKLRDIKSMEVIFNYLRNKIYLFNSKNFIMYWKD